MKNIELTEEHESKLLEMCNILFPKNNIRFIDDYYCEWSLFLVSDDDDDEMDIEDTIKIHWFEFCMTHLIRKIDNLYSEKILNPLEDKACKEGYPDNWSEIWNERPWLKLWSLTNSGDYKKHPVDYLYEEFLKLK